MVGSTLGVYEWAIFLFLQEQIKGIIIIIIRRRKCKDFDDLNIFVYGPKYILHSCRLWAKEKRLQADCSKTIQRIDFMTSSSSWTRPPTGTCRRQRRRLTTEFQGFFFFFASQTLHKIKFLKNNSGAVNPYFFQNILWLFL